MSKNVKLSRESRTRNFAIVVYEDSAPVDWLDRLIETHIPAFVSPYHDNDLNPDGSSKKPHWHVMLMFDSVKSRDQVDEVWDSVLGVNRVKFYENVNSSRGYARYLCHLDNPEKYQYNKSDVRAFAGADYDDVISLAYDDKKLLKEIFQYVSDNKVLFYSDLIDFAFAEKSEWFDLLSSKYSIFIHNYLKSLAAKLKSFQSSNFNAHFNPETGEIIIKE